MSIGKNFLQMMVDTPPPCTFEDPEIFFAGHDTQQNERNAMIAKTVCRTCPLIFSCRQFALETEDKFAILGGQDPNERSAAQERYNLRKEQIITLEAAA